MRHPQDESEAAEAPEAGLYLAGFQLEHICRAEPRLQRERSGGQTALLAQDPHGRSDAGQLLGIELDVGPPVVPVGNIDGRAAANSTQVAVVQVMPYLVPR